MRVVKIGMAVLLSVAGVAAQAQATFNFGAEAWNGVAGTSDVKRNESMVVNGSFLSTRGTVTAQAPGLPDIVQATVNAIANPSAWLLS